MERLCKRADVKRFGLHTIRHLTASVLYQAGQPVAVIQAILLHKSASTTERYLRSLGLEHTREALDGVFDGRNRGKVIHSPKKKPQKFLLQGLEYFRRYFHRLWLWRTGCNLLKFMASPRGFEPLFPA